MEKVVVLRKMFCYQTVVSLTYQICKQNIRQNSKCGNKGLLIEIRSKKGELS